MPTFVPKYGIFGCVRGPFEDFKATNGTPKGTGCRGASQIPEKKILHRAAPRTKYPRICFFLKGKTPRQGAFCLKKKSKFLVKNYAKFPKSPHLPESGVKSPVPCVVFELWPRNGIPKNHNSRMSPVTEPVRATKNPTRHNPSPSKSKHFPHLARPAPTSRSLIGASLKTHFLQPGNAKKSHSAAQI
jgi:hypothetical protein